MRYSFLYFFSLVRIPEFLYANFSSTYSVRKASTTAAAFLLLLR